MLNRQGGTRVKAKLVQLRKELGLRPKVVLYPLSCIDPHHFARMEHRLSSVLDPRSRPEGP